MADVLTPQNLAHFNAQANGAESDGEDSDASDGERKKPVSTPASPTALVASPGLHPLLIPMMGEEEQKFDLKLVAHLYEMMGQNYAPTLSPLDPNKGSGNGIFVEALFDESQVPEQRHRASILSASPPVRSILKRSMSVVSSTSGLTPSRKNSVNYSPTTAMVDENWKDNFGKNIDNRKLNRRPSDVDAIETREDSEQQQKQHRRAHSSTSRMQKRGSLRGIREGDEAKDDEDHPSSNQEPSSRDDDEDDESTTSEFEVSHIGSAGSPTPTNSVLRSRPSSISSNAPNNSVIISAAAVHVAGAHGLTRSKSASSLSSNSPAQSPTNQQRSLSTLASAYPDSKRFTAQFVDVAEHIIEEATHLFDQHNFGAARDKYKMALDVRKRTFGANHVSVADGISDIGRTYHAEDRPKEALKYFKQALKMRKTIQGRHHVDVSFEMSNVASVLTRLNEHKKALRKYQQALKIRREALGPDHVEVATALNNLAIIMRKLKDFEGAMYSYEEALRIKRKVHGHEHPSVSDTLNNIAVVFQAQGKPADAIRRYKEVLEMRVRSFGEEHVKVADTLYNIACSHWTLRDFPQALQTYKEALRIYSLSYGPEHPEIRDCQNQIELLSKFVRIPSVQVLSQSPPQ